MNFKQFKPKKNAYLLRYGGAILSVVVVLMISLGIYLFQPFIVSPLFLAAILFSAWWGGLRPGFVATILSGALIDYFFIPPLYQMNLSFNEIFRFLLFCAEGFSFTWLITTVLLKTEEISDSREQLRALSLHQQVLREEERKRISLEIHDELGQALTGLKMEVYLLGPQDKKGGKKNTGVSAEKVSELLKTIDTTIQTVRKIATELRPPILDDLGLIAAVEWQASEFEKRTGISCKLTTNLEDLDMDSDRATAVFRIFQEALTNIIRHADATSVNVSLNKLNQVINLHIKDNGRGIQEEELKSTTSLGILGMRERARLINGEVEIVGRKIEGTSVNLTFPYSGANVFN